MSEDPGAGAAGTRPSEIAIRVATRADLPDVLRVQRAGFRRVARALQIPVEELPPLRETLDDLEALSENGFTFFAADAAGRIVGTVRSETRPDGVVEVGRLAVDDGYLRRGVATRLMRGLEAHYPDAGRFELFTGAEAAEPIALYRGLGYRLFRDEEHGSVRLVWLMKER